MSDNEEIKEIRRVAKLCGVTNEELEALGYMMDVAKQNNVRLKDLMMNV